MEQAQSAAAGPRHPMGNSNAKPFPALVAPSHVQP